MELPVEHGLLLDNLLDLAHAPFTHTSTFAKGWTVPRFAALIISVDFLTITIKYLAVIFLQKSFLNMFDMVGLEYLLSAFLCSEFAAW